MFHGELLRAQRIEKKLYCISPLLLKTFMRRKQSPDSRKEVKNALPKKFISHFTYILVWRISFETFDSGKQMIDH